jgi:ACR3 family arsenite transporter
MTAINSLTMVILYTPLAMLLPGIFGICVPWEMIALSVAISIVKTLIAGYLTRSQVIKQKGMEWFLTKLVPPLSRISIIALLVTLIVLFTFQGYLIIELSTVISMISLAILVNILVLFGVSYMAGKIMRLSYENVAPVAITVGSNHFEVAIAVAITLFGVTPDAVLATVVGFPTEVTFMLILV